jgi:hypothetical protein
LLRSSIQSLLHIAMSTQSTIHLGDGSNGAFSVISINPSEVVDVAAGSNSTVQLRRWLVASGLGTMVMGAAAAFYRPPRGVIFERHRFAYYATLTGIITAGLAEVAGAAFWPSSSGCGERGRAHSRAFAATVFSASVVPLAAVIALGGFAIVTTHEGLSCRRRGVVHPGELREHRAVGVGVAPGVGPLF